MSRAQTKSDADAAPNASQSAPDDRVSEATVGERASAPHSGTSQAPSVPELILAGSTFARYEIVRCVGVGGMGAVFEATHTMLRKRVALKAMHGNLVRSESSRARFLREAETVARIRHANVVDISDVGVERGIPFLVMEFLEGEDLASLLERDQKLFVQRAVDLTLPILAGLAAVHRLGIVHRDVKPENVFLAVNALGDVVPKLVDFGVSKDLEANSTKQALRHTVAGTPYYMAPEQARGSAVLDSRADQYAVGVMMYQCLAGVRPYDSESLLELIHLIDAGKCVPLGDHCPELPPELLAVVERAMARRIEDRFETTEAFGQALLPFASEEVRASCAREFSHERRNTGQPREWTPEMLARLSADTVASDAGTGALPAVPVTTAAPRRSVSGVRARDTEPPAQTPSLRTRSRRAFVWAAAVTGVLLLIGFFVYLRLTPAPTPTTPEVVVQPETAPRAPEAQPASAGAVQQVEPVVEDKPATHDTPARRSKPKREEPKPSPVDIQLSR